MSKHLQHPVGVGMKLSTTALGSFIRARRLELGINQVSLASGIGVAQSIVSAVEIGQRTSLTDPQLKRFAEVLQCDLEELRGLVPVAASTPPTTDVGKLIRSRREELGLSLSAFATRMNISTRRANDLEVRPNTAIAYRWVQRLSTVLGLHSSAFGKFVGATRKETASELGRLVRSRRKELALSLGMLAKKLNVTRQHVNQIEFGRCLLSHSDARITQIARVLQLDVKRLEAVRPARSA